jgi:hypothetical protein
MNIILWALQAILAIKLLTASFSHGVQTSKPEMKQAVDKMGTSSRFWHALIAILAFVAAVGLILPGWLGFYPQLVIWTAIGTALLMLVSIYFHVRFREKPKVFVSVILLIFAVFVAYGRIVWVPL